MPIQAKQDQPKKLSEAVITHRQKFVDYVLNEAEPWHRKHLGRLYKLWED